MSRAIVFGVAVTGIVVLGTGCGENCNSSCFRIYDPGECGVQIPGQTAEALTEDCIATCRDALREVGPVGDYNPRGARNQVPENERQAAAWMDCVANPTAAKDADECAALANSACQLL